MIDESALRENAAPLPPRYAPAPLPARDASDEAEAREIVPEEVLAAFAYNSPLVV